MATRRALLIGIDRYQHIRPLDGCVNDSRLVRSVLVERFGFADAHITQLLNEQATRTAVLGAFDALMTATGANDVVVVHFAGHGSQIRDREGDEPSGFDSTLMPWDTAREPGENRDITDDEVHERLEALAAKTPHVTVLVDACHSGTVTRDAFGAKTRGVPPDLRPVTALPPSPIASRMTRTRSGASGWLPLDGKYVLIAGCRDDEESKEYVPAEGGGPHGALTWFLCQELRRATPHTTYRDVFDVVAARVTTYNRVQHPQMEGTADRTVFGVDDIAPAAFVSIASRDQRVVGLAAGSAQGVTVGSTYAVQAPGAKAHDGATAVGEIVVRAVAPFSAEAEVVREQATGAIAAGARAFETAHAFGEMVLAVHLASAEVETAFASPLRASTLLQVAPDRAAASARIYALPSRGAPSVDDPVPQAGALAAPMWAVVDGTGHLMMPLKARSDVAAVVRNLETIARYRRVLALDHPDPRNPLKAKVALTLMRTGPGGAFVPAAAEADGGQVIFDEGERVQFRLTNHDGGALFVAVIYLDASSAVDVIRQVRLEAATSLDIPGRVHFPPGYPFVDLADALRGVDAVDTMKLIVTREAVDFSAIEQTGVRSARSPLVSWLTAAVAPATRAFTPDVETPPPVASDAFPWATESRSFVIRRRATPLTATEAPVAIGHAVVTAPALTGTIGTGVAADGSDDTIGFATDALQDALAGADVAMRQTLTIDGARHDGPASRGAGAPAAIEVQLALPPEGYGQMVLAADELGVVSWVFAAPGPATRSADATTASRTYRLRSAVPEEPSGSPASRGVIGLVGRKVIKELVFPLVAPMLGAAGASAVHWLETTRWPYGVRTFAPDSYTNPLAPPIDRDGWRRLGSGKALLMVHGTFSRSHMAFGALPPAFIETLHREYGGRVFAFDHLFLSEDPAENVRWLVSQMPDDADLTLDIVCHSRGGLVSRVLSEKQSEISLGSRRLKIGKVVLVGVPNAGTALADPAHVATLLDVFTNLLNFVPDSFGAPALSMIVEFAKLAAVGALGQLKGLRSMHPTGDFARWLNAPAAVGDTQYFAMASNVLPAEPGLRHFVRSRALDALLKGGNDFVVPSDGVFAKNGSPFFPVASPLLLEGDHAVAHTKYFAEPRVRDQILTWLTA